METNKSAPSGTLALVFGILGLAVCGVFGPVAWFLGGSNLRQCRMLQVMPQGSARIGMILGIIGTVFLVIEIGLAALLIPAFSQAKGSAQEAHCMSKLKQIGIQSEIYRKEHGGSQYRLPSSTGRAFFRDLQSKLGSEVDGLFACQCKSGSASTITFRGPAKDVNGAKNYQIDDAILMCDSSEHRKGAIVLTKSYRCLVLPRGSPEYKNALAGTSE